jgi:3-oxoacyl-[acyl-carrier-protein] synthase II
LDTKEVRHYDRFIHLAVAATAEALADAGLTEPDPGEGERIGVIYGSGMGGLETILDAHTTLQARGARRVSPFMTPGSAINMAAGIISIRWGLSGPNYATVSACSTSSHAIADSFYAIQRGDADVMVTGGSEAVIAAVAAATFDNAGALSRHDGPNASRPFDRHRDGFVIAEGGATLILEELERARARGAAIYAELVGVGMTGDAYHVTAPDPAGSGSVRAMRRALEVGTIDPSEVQYINAHATSTKLGDVSETNAIKTVFGSHAWQLGVSSTKSMTGHMLGAAGAAEAAFTALALHHQVLPPTANLDEPDPECDLDYVAHKARAGAIEVALSNSSGFGGANITLAMRRYPH